MEKKKKPAGLSREDVEAELKRIAEAEAKIYGGQQTSLGLDTFNSENSEGSAEENAQPYFTNTEDPEFCKTTYHGIQGTITSRIPKGEVRKFVLNEKNLFLKASASTTDSKFTYKDALQTALNVVDKWAHSNETDAELGMAFWDINEKNGFHSHKLQKRLKLIK